MSGLKMGSGEQRLREPGVFSMEKGKLMETFPLQLPEAGGGWGLMSSPGNYRW